MEDIITMVGPRSVGKSTIGKVLAKELGWEFIDLDEYMNAVLKKDGGIGGFTDKYGWQTYMDLLHAELKKLLEIMQGKKLVLDCGGGTISSQFPASAKNAHLLNRRSKIVLILPDENDETNLKLLLERERKRPHFTNYPIDVLEKKVREDYFERLPGMKQFAHEIIHTKLLPPRDVAIIIKKIIDKN